MTKNTTIRLITNILNSYLKKSHIERKDFIRSLINQINRYEIITQKQLDKIKPFLTYNLQSSPEEIDQIFITILKKKGSQ